MSEIVPVILAAGRGSRLGIDHMPKPMVSVAGRPLMQEAVEPLFNMGFGPAEIRAVIGYQGEVIQKYFGADLTYCVQESLNGNAGALEAALPGIEDLRDKHILTIQGDDADQATLGNLQHMISFHLTRSADVTILTVPKPDSASNRIEYAYDSQGRVYDMIPRESVDSLGRYTGGIYLFSGSFLEDFFPKLKERTSDGKELGIAKLINLALESDQRVFQLCSEREYVSVNTPLGLQILRDREN